MRLYASKASVHPCSVSGGTMPVTGAHSVIESPDSVRRVTPPITTMRSTMIAQAMSHRRIAVRRAGWSSGNGTAAAVTTSLSSQVGRKLATVPAAGTHRRPPLVPLSTAR